MVRRPRVASQEDLRASYNECQGDRKLNKGAKMRNLAEFGKGFDACKDGGERRIPSS